MQFFYDKITVKQVVFKTILNFLFGGSSMDFFDNAINKAKDVIDTASKKTGEFVNTQKQKFDVSSIENKRAKDFEILGEIYYNKIKDTEIDDSNVAELVAAVTEKNEKIKQLKEEIIAAKNKRICPSCGAAIETTSNYCSACGIKLMFESNKEDE